MDRNTHNVFGLEDPMSTHAYELDYTVADEFLVPSRPVTHGSRLISRRVFKLRKPDANLRSPGYEADAIMQPVAISQTFRFRHVP